MHAPPLTMAGHPSDQTTLRLHRDEETFRPSQRQGRALEQHPGANDAFVSLTVVHTLMVVTGAVEDNQSSLKTLTRTPPTVTWSTPQKISTSPTGCSFHSRCAVGRRPKHRQLHGGQDSESSLWSRWAPRSQRRRSAIIASISSSMSSTFVFWNQDRCVAWRRLFPQRNRSTSLMKQAPYPSLGVLDGRFSLCVRRCALHSSVCSSQCNDHEGARQKHL